MKLFAVVALPPPVQGHAVVNRAVVDYAIACDPAAVAVYDIAPGHNARGLRYHLTRIERVLAAARAILFCRSRAITVYVVAEAGLGLVYNLLIVACARLRRARIVMHHHTSLHTKQYRPAFAVLARLAGRRTVHVVLCQTMADDLARTYSLVSSPLVSHNAAHIGFGTLSASHERRPGRLTLGLLSNLNRDKGLDLAIATLEAALARGCDYVLRLAGPFTDAAAHATFAAARARLGERIEWLGPVAATSKQAFFQSIDVLLFPTQYRFEAQPLVILEAMAYDIPVVSTDRGYIADLLGVDLALPPEPERFVALALGRLAALVDREQPAERPRARYLSMRATALRQREVLMGAMLGEDRAPEPAQPPVLSMNGRP